MTNPTHLAAADQRRTELNATNREMVDDAARLLREHGDPTKTWAVLGWRMAEKTGTTPADPVAHTAIEALAALYIECAQTRTAGEEGR